METAKWKGILVGVRKGGVLPGFRQRMEDSNLEDDASAFVRKPDQLIDGCTRTRGRTRCLSMKQPAKQ